MRLPRSHRPRRPCISLGFASIFVILVAAVYFTAYNVGNSSMATRGMEKLDLTARIIRSKEERYQKCQSRKLLLKNGQETVSMALQAATDTQIQLETEIELLRNRNAITLQTAEECKRKLERLKEKGIGTDILAAQLERLGEHRKNFLNAIAAVNKSGGRIGREEISNLITATVKEVGRLEGVARNMTEVLARCNNAMTRYSIVFDAGSTGSRVHVFRYNLTFNPHAGDTQWHAARPSLMPFLLLDDELFLENHEPLSGFQNPDDAVASLASLFDAAKAYIPEPLHVCAPIELKATAGLRRIGREQAEAVLTAVRRYFAKGPFWLQSELNSVRILEGREEGPLAWLTVNYLLGTLNSGVNTATIVDLGGGSTQIVMQPSDEKVLSAHAEFSHEFKINNRSFVVYQHSYEGNGLHAAKEQLLHAMSAGLSNNDTTTGTDTRTDADGSAAAALPHDTFPCFPKGYVNAETGVSNKRNGGRAPSMEECVALFYRHVVRGREPCGANSCGFNGVFQPNVSTAATGPVYAFSFYYDRLSPYIKDEVISVRDVFDIATHLCDSMKSAEEILAAGGDDMRKKNGTVKPEMECFELSYLFALLHHGFGFPLEQQLHIAKKINGYETAWALGASLVTLEGKPD